MECCVIASTALSVASSTHATEHNALESVLKLETTHEQTSLHLMSDTTGSMRWNSEKATDRFERVIILVTNSYLNETSVSVPERTVPVNNCLRFEI